MECERVNMVIEVAKSAVDMVKAGDAKWDTSGIRGFDGQMIAGYRPVSIGETEQDEGTLQQTVKKALKIIKALNRDSATGENSHNTFSGAGSGDILKWVQAIATLVDIGISVAGFYMTLTKLNSIGGELHEFFGSYKNDKEAEELEKYHNYLQSITNDLEFLRFRYKQKMLDDKYFLTRSHDIENKCIQTSSFLQTVLESFQKGQMDGQLACQILFTLTPVYAKLFSEYCYQYRMILGRRHCMLDTWISTLNQIRGEEFRDFLKREMAFGLDYAEVSPAKRVAAWRIAFESLDAVHESIIACDEAAAAAEPGRLIPVEDLLREQAWETIAQYAQLAEGTTLAEYMKQQALDSLEEITDEQIRISIPLRTARAN